MEKIVSDQDPHMEQLIGGQRDQWYPPQVRVAGLTSAQYQSVVSDQDPHMEQLTGGQRDQWYPPQVRVAGLTSAQYQSD